MGMEGRRGTSHSSRMWLKPISWPWKSRRGGVFNVACGCGVSLNELAAKIMRITKMSIAPVYEAARPGDVRDSLADISRARRELGYEPEYDLDMGLEKTVEWFAKHL